MKEIVIKISDEIYNDILTYRMYTSPRDVPLETFRAIRNGIVLPKGHGRLIDVDKAIENEEAFYKYFSITTHPLMIGKIINCVAPSVIEADKEKQK